MARRVLEFRCFLISPGDVATTRSMLTECVANWNAHVGLRLKARVELVRWESHSVPDLTQSPQGVINQQILADCDFGVAIFWSRLGTPTEEYRSGSLEELDRLRRSGKRVLAYFCERPIPQDALRDSQFSELQAFRGSLAKEGLLGSYHDDDELNEKFALHLTNLVSMLLVEPRANPPSNAAHSTKAKVGDLRYEVAIILAKAYTVAELTSRGLSPFLSEHEPGAERFERFFDCVYSVTSNKPILLGIGCETADEVRIPQLYVPKEVMNVNDPSFFYVFVVLDRLYERPDFYIVPSAIISQRVQKRPGAPHLVTIQNHTVDLTDFWHFEDSGDEFLEAWHLLPGVLE